MVGRSNVGKSSLINALVRKKLARTSAAPGKTRLANFYRVAAEPRRRSTWWTCPASATRAAATRRARNSTQLAADVFRRAPARTRGFAVFVLVDSRHPGLEAIAARGTGSVEHRRRAARRGDEGGQTDAVRTAASSRELERLYSGPVTPVSAETGEGLDALWKRSNLTTTATAAAPPPPAPAAAPPTRRRSRSEPSTSRRSRICVDRADQDRARPRDPRRHRHAQAGADLRDPPRPAPRRAG